MKSPLAVQRAIQDRAAGMAIHQKTFAAKHVENGFDPARGCEGFFEVWEWRKRRTNRLKEIEEAYVRVKFFFFFAPPHTSPEVEVIAAGIGPLM